MVQIPTTAAWVLPFWPIHAELISSAQDCALCAGLLQADTPLGTLPAERLALVALYSWITDLDSQDLHAALPDCLRHLGLELYPELCSSCQLYAEDPADAQLPMAQRVKVVVSRLTAASHECQVEVYSAEPMVRRQTRCQAMAEALQQAIPARGA